MVKLRKERKGGGKQKGQALVEFALVSIPLLLLVIGLVDLGVMYERRITLTNAVRDGARYASLHPNAFASADPAPANTVEGAIQAEALIPSAQITAVVYSIDSSGNKNACGSFDGHTWTTLSSPCQQPGDLIQVTATGHYRFLTPYLNVFAPPGIPITVSATMLEEQ